MKSNLTILKSALCIIVLLVASFTNSNATATPVNASGNLDQARNGGVGQPAISPVVWENGNQNSQKSHYHEGNSIGYRLVLSDLKAGSHTVIISWDVRAQGKNAIDFITFYQQGILETVNPVSGTGLSAGVFTTYNIPAPTGSSQPLATFNALQAAGKTKITLFNGTITSVSYITQGNLSASNSSAKMKITFTSGAGSAVLAWGGHIASATDWGAGNSAISINGSPYHTRFISIDSFGGNQDRSLKISACTFIANITITTPLIMCKNQCAVLNSNGSSFNWSNGALTPSTSVCNDGTYFVTASDVNNCSAMAQITLAPQPALNIAADVTNISGCNECNGGINLTVSNAVGTPTFNWFPAATTEDLQNLCTEGSYNVTVRDVNGCSTSAAFDVNRIGCVPANPCNIVALVNENNNLCDGPYQLISEGGTIYTWAPSAGLSATNISNPIANPTITTIYTVTVCGGLGANLITNGNFEAGNTGFTSDYTFQPDIAGNTELIPPALYCVASNASDVHPLWTGLANGGSGNYMIINGYTESEKTVWQQTVAVTAGQEYSLSAMVSAIYPEALANLEFSIDGVIIGSNFSPVLPVGTWKQFSTYYTATSSGNIVIRILDTNTFYSGNDYGIDDISFATVCCSQATVEVAICDGSRAEESIKTPNVISAYPNPVTDKLNVSIDAKTTVVEVYNCIGQIVYSKILNTNDHLSTVHSINFSNLSSGIYMIAMESGTTIQTTKVIKK